MQTIRRWAYDDDFSPRQARITFEGANVVLWDQGTGELTLQGDGSDEVQSEVRAFLGDQGAKFTGSREQLQQTLEKSFPSRPLPTPIPGYDLVMEKVEGALTTYLFTGGSTVTYREDQGQVICDDKNDIEDNPLKWAVYAAFPSGASVLTGTEMSTVLRHLTEFSPAVPTSRPMEQVNNERPLRSDTAYKDWYPHDTVRVGLRTEDKSQEDMLDRWWNILQGGGQNAPHLLAHAPTGLGKTSAALAPALTWQQQAPESRQVYYLVTTVNQHDNPIKDLQRLVDLRATRGLKTTLRVVDLAGQNQVTVEGTTFCRTPHGRPTDEMCAESRRAHDWGLLPNRPLSWRDVATHLNDEDICPYHYLQGLMETADVVVCDYWWVFDPDAAVAWDKTSHFGHKEVVLIVDEAHNLIPRVRTARDVQVRRDELKRRLQNTANAAARDALQPLLGSLFDNGKLAVPAARPGLAPSQVCATLDVSLLEAALAYWNERRAEVGDEGERMTIEERLVRNLLVPASDDDNVVIYTVAERPSTLHPIAREPMLHVRRVNATDDLKRGYGRVKASLTMSGTLVAPKDPEDELKMLVPQFALPEGTEVFKAASPFAVDHQQWVYSSLPLGKYYDRQSWYTYYQYEIVESGRATPGVTAVFFSSYEFMQAVLDEMPATEQALVVRERRSGDAAAEATSIEEYNRLLRERLSGQGTIDAHAYLFAVYTGKLAQGANFAGNLIKTVICVSVPAEMVELFHEQLCRQLWSLLYPNTPPPSAPLNDRNPAHKAEWAAAWQYAYERPSMFEVLQATGRGIRTPMDRCAFVLLDQRYDEFKWHNVLAPEPFHTDTPHTHVANFHAGAPARFLEVTGRWEALLPTFHVL